MEGLIDGGSWKEKSFGASQKKDVIITTRKSLTLTRTSSQESERLTALRQCKILDVASDPSFERFTAMAARCLRAPMAFVTLIDTNRQWFKSRLGMTDVSEKARDISLFTDTVLNETIGVMVVEDTLLDPRFQRHSLVTSSPNIRFYAGATLLVNDLKVGVLSVVDTRPHVDFDDKQLSLLAEFADTIAGIISDRRKMSVETQFNGVHMHQSLLCLLQEPLRKMNDSADHIDGLIHASKDDNQTPLQIVGLIKNELTAFQRDATYFQSLLDTSLRSLCSIAFEDSISAIKKLSMDASATDDPIEGFFAGLLHQSGDKKSWLTSINELLVMNNLPPIAVTSSQKDKQVDSSTSQDSLTESDFQAVSLVSHPDLLLLTIAAMLGHLASSGAGLDSIACVHQPLLQLLTIDIKFERPFHENFSVMALQSSSMFDAAKAMVKWVDGRIDLYPADSVYRIEVSCRDMEDHHLTEMVGGLSQLERSHKVKSPLPPLHHPHHQQPQVQPQPQATRFVTPDANCGAGASAVLVDQSDPQDFMSLATSRTSSCDEGPAYNGGVHCHGSVSPVPPVVSPRLSNTMRGIAMNTALSAAHIDPNDLLLDQAAPYRFRLKSGETLLHRSFRRTSATKGRLQLATSTRGGRAMSLSEDALFDANMLPADGSCCNNASIKSIVNNATNRSRANSSDVLTTASVAALMASSTSASTSPTNAPPVETKTAGIMVRIFRQLWQRSSSGSFNGSLSPSSSAPSSAVSSPMVSVGLRKSLATSSNNQVLPVLSDDMLL